ncbi:GNAT family N-acetyltransferase [Mesobacterium pallidum]|uniref:GNAT family N-acetyltransferase n=1 Tax=Mesobacterium pallidum TaxID=2872037 RepID=UPI001EE39FDB|nr:GNAT family N-acetyltransferase [Mesobacterium pallidum]
MIRYRAPKPEELPAASALCRASKASWGYDAAFMDACREALTLHPEDLDTDPTLAAFDGDRMVGLVQVAGDGDSVWLEKLFVAPDRMGRGIGRRLFHWALLAATRLGAGPLIVDADPGAVPFYTAMGCRLVGEAPSDAIPGRMLPRLARDLPDLPRA